MYNHHEAFPVESQEKLSNVCLSIHSGVAVSIFIRPKLSDPSAVQVLRNELREALLPLSVKGWDIQVWTGKVEDE